MLKGLIKGNPHDFREFYDAYIGRAYGVAVGIVKDRELAKDAVQETFIRVYKYIADYDSSKPFDPWFYRILHNECMRLLKKEEKPRRTVTLEEELSSSSLFDEPFEGTELIDAIESLKEPYRIPIVLKYLEGFSEKEISSIMDLNQNTVKSRLFHARKKLKLFFEHLNKGDLS